MARKKANEQTMLDLTQHIEETTSAMFEVMDAIKADSLDVTSVTVKSAAKRATILARDAADLSIRLASLLERLEQEENLAKVRRIMSA